MSENESSRKKILPEGYSCHPEGYIWCVLPEEQFAPLPETVDLHGKHFFKKTEFHVTVLNARETAKHIGRTETETIEDIEHHLQVLLADYLRDHTIEFVKFEDDLRLAIKPERESIAARCVMTGLEKYYEQIQSVYGFIPDAQPTHVSLYTLNGSAVGINTVEQMEAYQKVEIPKVQNILQGIRFS